MSWSDIWKIVLTCIASVGGIGGIITAVVKFSAGIITDRLSKDYQNRLSKEIEKLKTELSKKEYVSKTRFDTEFSIYRELGMTLSEMVKCINLMIPYGLTTFPKDEDKRTEYENNCFANAVSAVIKAQDALYANIAFIPENIYDEYQEVLRLSQMQVRVFEHRYNVLYLSSQKEREQLKDEDYERTNTLNKKWQELNKSIRDYLSKLEIIE